MLETYRNSLFIRWKQGRNIHPERSAGVLNEQHKEARLGFNTHIQGFPCSSVSKESACSAGDRDSIPGLGGSPGEENGNPLQYPCLENLMDRSLVGCNHGVAKSWARLSNEHLLTYVSLSSLVAQLVKNLPAMQETRVRSPGREDLKKKMATHSSPPLPGDFHEQRSWQLTVHGIPKSRT